MSSSQILHPSVLVTSSREGEQGQLLVVAGFLGDRHVGRAVFQCEGLTATAIDVFVDSDDRRKGVASALYNHVVDKGFSIHPSKQLTPDSMAFWQKRVGERPAAECRDYDEWYEDDLNFRGDGSEAMSMTDVGMLTI